MDEWMGYLRQGGTGTLLLVAVEGQQGAEGWPCRIVGAVSPLGNTAPRQTASEPITHLLTEAGIPSNLLGYGYLRTGIALVMEDGMLRRSLTGELYPRIAQQYGATPRGVERAIRHAIGVAWTRFGGEGYYRALGRLASCVGERPTNAEFISQAAECLMLRGIG